MVVWTQIQVLKIKLLLHYVLYKRLLVLRFLLYFFTLPPKEIIYINNAHTNLPKFNQQSFTNFIYLCLFSRSRDVSWGYFNFSHSFSKRVYFSYKVECFSTVYLCRLLIVSFDYLYSLYKSKSVPYII